MPVLNLRRRRRVSDETSRRLTIVSWMCGASRSRVVGKLKGFEFGAAKGVGSVTWRVLGVFAVSVGDCDKRWLEGSIDGIDVIERREWARSSEIR